MQRQWRLWLTPNPGDADAQALAAEAAMILAPYRYWSAAGAARPGTTVMVSRLRRAMRAAPGHIGACHFFVHVMETVDAEARCDTQRVVAGSRGARRDLSLRISFSPCSALRADSCSASSPAPRARFDARVTSLRRIRLTNTTTTKAGSAPAAGLSLTAEHALPPIGVTGFEPATSCSRSRRSTGLSYAPKSVSSLHRMRPERLELPTF